MKIKFCGAARQVTGSSHLITLSNGMNILLDCGLFQGKGRKVWDDNNTWHFDPKDIDVLVLSHAHIDHTGRVPQLVKDGFNGILVPPKNSLLLANALESLINNTELRSKYGSNGLNIVKKDFSSDIVNKMTIDLYTQFKNI